MHRLQRRPVLSCTREHATTEGPSNRVLRLPFSGDKLRERRLRAGLSQVQLAELAGCTQKTVASLEGGRRAPHPATLAELARALGVELGELCDETTADAFSAPGSDTLPPPPPDAIGRDADVRALAGLLTGRAAGGHARALVYGWPGVGKTTLSLLIGHDPDLRKEFTDGVFWTSLGQRPDLRDELLAWCRSAGLHEIELQTTSTHRLTHRLAHALRSRRVLLIVDDAWSVEDVMPFVVGGPRAAMLITTRVPALSDELVSTDATYPLGVLSSRWGIELLRSLIPRVVADHPVESEQLVEALEGLPLALRVAGRLLRKESRRGFTIDTLLRDLRNDPHLIYTGDVPADLLASGRAPKVAALLARSTNVLDARTRERFAMLGALLPKPAVFHEDLVRAAWEVDDVRATLGELVDRGLVEAVGPQTYQIHALLAVHARAMLGSEEPRS